MGRRPPMGHGEGFGPSGPTRKEYKGTGVVAAPRRPSPSGFVVVVLLRAPILGLRVKDKTRPPVDRKYQGMPTPPPSRHRCRIN